MDYPYAKEWKDRHGKMRWRYRRGKTVIYLPGLPGEEIFERAYYAASNGLKPSAEITKLPGGVIPKSLRHAWQQYKNTSPDWPQLTEIERKRQTKIADSFLTEPVTEGATEFWGDMPIADLKRKHLKGIIAAWSDKPHAARRRLDIIRKMIEAGLDEEWIEADPSHKLGYRPETTRGFRAWRDDELAAFESHWQIGTAARLVYELALWIGARRGDITKLAPADIIDGCIAFNASKNSESVLVPCSPSLLQCLTHIDTTAPRIVMTAYGEPSSPNALGERMRMWASKAGLEIGTKEKSGPTLHGLRKTLGKRVAEAGGSARMSGAILGHRDLQQVELYSREANKNQLARDGMTKVFSMVEERQKRAG